MLGQDGWILASFFFCEFMDLDFGSVHKHVKKELGHYPAILTSHLVNNPYLSFTRPCCRSQIDAYSLCIIGQLDRLIVTVHHLMDLRGCLYKQRSQFHIKIPWLETVSTERLNQGENKNRFGSTRSH